MRRLTGWLALIVILGGLGVLVYEDVRMRSERTEMPSAITAGTPEGPDDATAETTPAADSTIAAGPATGASMAADAPATADRAPDVMASAQPSPAAEPPAAADVPGTATEEAPEAPPVADAADAAPPASFPAEAPEAVEPDLAETPDEAPAESHVAIVDVAPVAEPEAAVAPDVAGASPAAAPEPVPSPDVAPSAPEAIAPAPEAAPPEAASVPEPEPAQEASTPEAPAPDAAAVPESESEPTQQASAPDAAVESPPPMEQEPADVAAVPDDTVEVEVAAAPEIPTQQLDGAAPPVSESAGRDSMMQAAAESPPADAAEAVVAAVDPAADVEAPRPVAAPESIAPGTDSETAMVVPSFDIVRVEPTGDAVIAGVAAPGATVEVTDGASTVATTVASDSGDWAIALDQPLGAGQHDLGIRARSKDTGAVAESDQRVAVLVPETPAEEPLVVLNTPDAPSTVLQVPVTPAPKVADVAALDAPAAPEAAPAPVGEEVAAAADGEAEPPPAAEVVTSPPTPESGAPEPSAAETDIAAAPSPAPDQPDAGVSEQPEVVAVAPSTGPDGRLAVPAEPEAAAVDTAAGPPEVAPETAAVEPEPEPEPVAAPIVAVTAVEAETSGALFVAGTATAPEDVRVYVDDVLLGEVTPSPSGTWLLEVQRELPAGTYQVRADQVEPGAGTVLARAEVPFEREVEVAILKPVAEVGGGTGAEATGTMAGPTTLIIKRRDNLWRISRQLYGKGIRWSTIYQANKDQIRNPRWIYPGQVFVLPEGNVEWEENAAN